MIITLNDRWGMRGGLAADLASVNEILLLQEPCFETDTRKMKFGDGVTHWNDLPYAGSAGSPWTSASRVGAATTDSWVHNVIGAASVPITTPPTPTVGDQFSLYFPATRAGCTVVANTGFTILGSGSAIPLSTPGSSRKGILVFVLIGTDWIPLSVNTWT